MCGIAGVWNRAETPLMEGVIDHMQKTLAHRGPDAAGTYVHTGAAFAHARLSIIDLSPAGSQPFLSADSRYVLVFNGEIYNYKELREKYFQGETFQSDSDTEVLLYMLIRFGADALTHLRGMFSFAFFDTQERKMILACDAFGKKPLFYAWSGNTFLFASEPKAILASGYVTAELDTFAVAPYLLHEYCPSPLSGFKGVYTLGAGQYMEVTSDTQKIVRWWKPEVLPKKSPSFTEALSTLDTLLGTAVERRMVADVPVGLFLSGGLDSSTIGWYMRQIKKDGEIHSCSVAFEDESFNEEHIASRVASSLDFTHHSTTFTADAFLESIRELAPLLDSPLADASLLPTYVVSKLAGEHMKVVLDGDGSDELLGGYGTFSAYELARSLQWVPSGAWETLSRMVDTVVPVSHRYFSSDFKAKSFLRGMAYPPERNIQVWLGAFTDHELPFLLQKEAAIPLRTVFDTADSLVPPSVHDAFDRASLYHIHAYLNRDILVKIDRATMAVGLEARTPFLDTDVAEFLLRLPASFKRNKRLLRELMKGRLPEFVVSRKKQGFGIPISSWFSQDLLFFVEEVLSREKIEEGGIFHYPYIRTLIDEHRTKLRDHRKKLWTVITFQLWYEHWILQTGKK
jgi:asparagine synthase (glutamine-hydrolysing)